MQLRNVKGDPHRAYYKIELLNFTRGNINAPFVHN